MFVFFAAGFPVVGIACFKQASVDPRPSIGFAFYQYYWEIASLITNGKQRYFIKQNKHVSKIVSTYEARIYSLVDAQCFPFEVSIADEELSV